MRAYLLVSATLVAVCVGCAGTGSPGVYNVECEPVYGGGGYQGGGHLMHTPHHRIHHGQQYFAPPAAMMARPGPMVDGPGPGVLATLGQPGGPAFASVNTQVRFVGPDGILIGWQIGSGFADSQLIAPASYDFGQGATYRLKVANLPNREGKALYPTLQVYPAHPATDAYLAHNSVPVQITDEDLDQVDAHNFLTKVIYLPDAKHQELAIAGVETLVSTRLDPGIDPVAEAERRGTILLVLRIGNKDYGTPPVVVGADGVQQAGHIQTISGEKQEFAPPMPIGGTPSNSRSVPNAMLMGGPRGFGQPAQSPIGLGPTQSWGMPRTGTPIGLVGPTHLPYGGPAGLRSHTIRNKTPMEIHGPVDHQLIDVRHYPGLKLPPPVKHIEYEEIHPVTK